ncbi:MAG: hypothetical protein ACTSO7_13980 [Candidatus Heimdallarchaeota archaeon]
MSTNETDDPIIDGKKEITINHSRNKILLETLYFVFWVAIGCLSVVVGATTQNQSLAFRIIFMVLGIGFMLLFLVPFLSVILNKLILTEKEIRIRNYFRWETIAWSNLATLQLERRTPSAVRSNSDNSRTTLVEFVPEDDSETLIFPLFRYKSEEADQIVSIIKEYFEKNQGVALNERIVTSKKDLEEEDVMYFLPIPPKFIISA